MRTSAAGATRTIAARWARFIAKERVEGQVTRVSHDKPSPAFPPPLSLLTGICIVVWIVASIANPTALTALLNAVLPLLVLVVMLVVVGQLFPFARPLSQALLKGMGLVFGVTLLGGYGLVRGAQKARAGGRGEPRDLLIEVKEAKTGDKFMVRFVRAAADIAIPTGAQLTAEGKIRGTTLVAEGIEVSTGLGRLEAVSAGAVGRVFAYLWLAVSALLASSALAALIAR